MCTYIIHMLYVILESYIFLVSGKHDLIAFKFSSTPNGISG
jgi:hypothetical protein